MTRAVFGFSAATDCIYSNVPRRRRGKERVDFFMDGVYRTNVCGIDVAFYATGRDEETDMLVQRVRERVRGIMNEGGISVSKAAVMACLEAEEDNVRLTSEIKRLLAENERLSAELRDLSLERSVSGGQVR